jgi:hypothetical protein
MKKPEPQTLKILTHLLTGSELTTLEAFKYFGYTRLAARILDLQRKGFHIKRQIVKRDQKYVTAYSL